MDEAEFVIEAEGVLSALEVAIEAAAEAAGVDIDVEVQAGGVLQLNFENDSQIIINRHVVAREIWVAARTGGFHFRPVGGQWLGTRDGQELWTALSSLISQQAGAPIMLTRA